MLFCSCNLARCFNFKDLIAPAFILADVINKIGQQSNVSYDKTFEISSFVKALRLLVTCSG